ncbi:MAG: spore cortex biosynthesis protein YabQ [Ruminiclostridium sp.]|nr:spore cortex biosynthesis protein YabQ [Ruminiclostridium sp.]
MNVQTSIIDQTLSFIICGAVIGVLYEPLRILRLFIKHRSLLTGIEDTLFFALSGFILFGLSMNIGGGRFRMVYLIGAAIGAFAYFFTLGKIVKLLFTVIIKAFVKIFRFVFTPIIKIVGVFTRKIKRLLVRLHEKLYTCNQKSLTHLKNSTHMLYNVLCINKERSVENDIRIKIKAKVKK